MHLKRDCNVKWLHLFSTLAVKNNIFSSLLIIYFCDQSNKDSGLALLTRACSQLVEGDDINRLHFVFKLFYLFLNQVRGDLVVLNCRPNDDLEDTISNGLLLPLSLPHQSVHLDAKDFISQHLKVSVFAPRLYFPDDK